MGFFDVIVMAARVAQFIFAVIVLGTAGYAASLYHTTYDDGFVTYYTYTPSQVSFLIFVAVWSILVVLWQVLTPRFAKSLAHRFVVLGLDALTMLFWFAGFIALAVITPVVNDLFRNYVGSGYAAQQTAVAFGAFSWLAFLITTVLSAIDIFRGHGSKHNPELHNAA